MKSGGLRADRPRLGRAGGGSGGVRVGLAFAALFSVNAAAMAWLPVWLGARGLSGAEVGFAVAAGLALRTLAAPLGGVLADTLGRSRAVLTTAGAALLLGYALLPPAGPLWAVAAAIAVTGAGMGPAIPVLEVTALRLGQTGGPPFGPMRAAGSLAFMATTVGLGLLVAARGESAILGWLIAGSAAFLLAAAGMPEPPPAREAGAPRAPILPALLSRPVVLALAASALIQASHAYYYGFASLTWRAQGLPEALVGGLWAWGVAAEALLLWFAGKAARIGPARLLAAGAGAAALRWGLMALEPGPLGLAATQTLHALSFGAAHLGLVLFVRDRAPPHVAATAVALNSALTFGVLLAGATALSGLLYEQGGPLGWLAMSALALAGLAVAALLSRSPDQSGN